MAFVIIYDLLFFSPLFYPVKKSIITPDLGGGDSISIQMPFKYKLCQKIKEKTLPFWVKDMGLGYPLMAEGEVGVLNPINIITCALFDYKAAFNYQMILHSAVGQIGLILLAFQLGLSIYAGLFLAALFPFAPIILMSYMEISIVYPLFFLPFILAAVLRLIKKQSIKNVILLSLAIFFQFLVSHLQVSFTSAVFIFSFLIIHLYLKKTKLSKSVKALFLCGFSYVVGGLFAAAQLLPSLEFFSNSNRGSVLSGSYAATYDQNFVIKNILTIFYPYIFGKAQTGTFTFGAAFPWESTLFIYYLPLIFLLLAIKFREKLKQYFLYELFFVFLLLFLIALGKNSPISFIHSLPGFSSFRFPTRFVYIMVFILSLISTLALHQVFNMVKRKVVKYLLFLIIIVTLLIEQYTFNYNFHVLYDHAQLFTTQTISRIVSNKDRIYVPDTDVYFISKKYINEGYMNENRNFFYHYLNDLSADNTGLIYGRSSINLRIGPYIHRNNLLISDIIDKKSGIDLKEKEASFSAMAKNKLYLMGTDYVISSFKYKNSDFLELQETIPNKTYDYKINLYRYKGDASRIKFYNSSKYVETYADVKDSLENDDLSKFVLLEDVKLSDKYYDGPPVTSSYEIIDDKDEYLKFSSTTDIDSILVLADNYYPGWAAFVDGKRTPIFRANFAFRGVELPKGKHTVVFKYEPVSFYLGAKISLISMITLLAITIIAFLRRRLRRS